MASAAFKKTGEVPMTFSVNPRYPCKVSLNSGSVSAETEGGDDYVYRKGTPFALMELKFEGLPASDFDGGFDYAAMTQAPGTQSLANWFINIFSPAREPFIYTDPFGTDHAVTIEGDRLDFALTDFGLHDGMIILKERIG